MGNIAKLFEILGLGCQARVGICQGSSKNLRNLFPPKVAFVGCWRCASTLNDLLVQFVFI